MEKNYIRISHNQLNEMIEATVDALIKEGLLDNMRSGFNNVKGAWQRFTDGYETKEGNPQSIEDVFEGDGWKIHATVPKNGATYYFVSRQTGDLGTFYGQEVNEMVDELNIFLGGNRAKYIGKHPEKKYLEIFRIV